MAQDAAEGEEEKVGAMFAAFQALENLAMDGLRRVVCRDFHFHTADVVLGVIGITDITTKIYRHYPCDFFLRTADLGAYRLIEAMKQEAVRCDLLFTASIEDSLGFVFGEKMPRDGFTGVVFGWDRRQPIAAHGGVVVIAVT